MNNVDLLSSTHLSPTSSSTSSSTQLTKGSLPGNYVVKISDPGAPWQSEVTALGVKIIEKIATSDFLLTFRFWVSNETQLQALKDKSFVATVRTFRNPFTELGLQRIQHKFSSNHVERIIVSIEDETDKEKINRAISECGIPIINKVPLSQSESEKDEKWNLEITSMKQIEALSRGF